MGTRVAEITLLFPAFIQLKGMSYSEIEKTKFMINTNYDPFYQNFLLKKGTELTARHLIRSAVLTVETSVNDPFKIYDEPLKIKF